MGVGARIRYLFAGLGFLFVGFLGFILSKFIGWFFIAVALWSFYGAFKLGESK